MQGSTRQEIELKQFQYWIAEGNVRFSSDPISKENLAVAIEKWVTVDISTLGLQRRHLLYNIL